MSRGAQLRLRDRWPTSYRQHVVGVVLVYPPAWSGWRTWEFNLWDAQGLVERTAGRRAGGRRWLE
jgi:hypothetical protein